MTVRVTRVGPALIVMVVFAASCGNPGTAASSATTSPATREPTPSPVSDPDIQSPRPLEIEGAIPLPDALDLMPG